MARRGFQHVAHIDIDRDVRGCGPTKELAFEKAALALIAVMFERERVRSGRAVSIAGTGLADDGIEGESRPCKSR